MAAPVVAGSVTGYTGYTLDDLVEAVLNHRGMTADSANYDFTLASANTIARVKRYIRDGLAFLYTQREHWYPLRTADVVAQAQTDSKYSRVAIPADAATVIGCAIAGQTLDIIDVATYFRTLRPDAEGGGSSITADAGDPQIAVFRIGTLNERILEVLPPQDATFTLTIFYKASGAALSSGTDQIVLPLQIQPLLILYVAYFMVFMDGDIRAAREAWAHFQERLEEVSFMPPAAGTAPRVTSTLPVETR